MKSGVARKLRPAGGEGAPAQRARLFWNGRSQAVRLPKEFRFAGEEVVISREGDRVVLSPVSVERDQNGWPRVFWDLAGAVPELDLGDRNVPHERPHVFGSGRR